MRKSLVALLAAGLLLLGVTPVWAAGQAMAAAPAQQDEVVQVVVVPGGVALEESELQTTQGEFLGWWVVAGAVGVAIAGAIESYVATGKVDTWAVVKSALAGAAVAAANPAGALISEAQVFGRTLTAAAKVGKYLRDGAIAGGTLGVLERAARGHR